METMNPLRRGQAASLGALVVGLLASASAGSAQEPEDLGEAVAFYHEHATSDLPHIQRATARFEALAVASPGEAPYPAWLAPYWTAFAYTQLSLFARDERSRPYLELARAYLEKAREDKPDGDARVDADFMALEGLLLGFEGGANPDEREDYAARSGEAWEQARSIDPENPMSWMNEGLGLIADEDTRAEAYRILDRAIELYEPRMDSPLPNWGREFIDVWMGNYPRSTGGPADGARSDPPAVHDFLAFDPAEWAIRQDREGVGDVPRITRNGEGLRVLTGGSAILYPPSEPMAGPYRVTLEVSLFDPAGRNEGFGLIFGGRGLAGPDLQYTYYLMRQDGMVLVKHRSGTETVVVRDWREAPTLRSWTERPESRDRVTNSLVVEVQRDVVLFLANGEEVHRLPAREVDTSGRLGLRINHGVHVQVSRLIAERLG